MRWKQLGSSIKPQGGITAWYTMYLTAIGNDNEKKSTLDLSLAISQYEQRDENHCVNWQRKFTGYSLL